MTAKARVQLLHPLGTIGSSAHLTSQRASMRRLCFNGGTCTANQPYSLTLSTGRRDIGTWQVIFLSLYTHFRNCFLCSAISQAMLIGISKQLDLHGATRWDDVPSDDELTEIVVGQ